MFVNTIWCFCAGKSTLTVVSFADYAWFEEWKDDKVKNRQADYKALKETLINTILETVTQIYPKIKDRVCGFTMCHLRLCLSPALQCFSVLLFL